MSITPNSMINCQTSWFIECQFFCTKLLPIRWLEIVGHGSLVVDGCRVIFDLVKNLIDESIGALMGVALCSRVIGGACVRPKPAQWIFLHFAFFRLAENFSSLRLAMPRGHGHESMYHGQESIGRQPQEFKLLIKLQIQSMAGMVNPWCCRCVALKLVKFECYQAVVPAPGCR